VASGSTTGGSLEQRRWWPWIAGVGAIWIAAVHSALWALDRPGAPRLLWGDENTYLASALRLLAGDPGWSPESLWPQLYPQFVAGLVSLGSGSLVWLRLSQTALLAIMAMILFDLTNRWTGSRAAGWAAAWLTLGYPPLVAFSHYLWPEVLHLFLFVSFLWLVSVRPVSALRCAVAGVALGLALITKSLLLLFVPVVAVAMVWGRPPARAALELGLVIGLTALTVAPTVVGNQRRTGRIGIANSSVFNLWVGLNDVGRDSFRHDVVWPEYRSWVSSAASDVERNRILRDKIRELFRQRGVVEVVRGQLAKQYFRLFDSGSYLTDQLPGGAAETQSGAGYVKLGPELTGTIRALSSASVVMLLAAGTAGLVIGRFHRRTWLRVLILFIAYNLALFLWLHVKTRYRIQMLPAAFVGVGGLVAWFEAGCRPRPSFARVVIATLLVAVLLWFALG
jgi:hypothetical protein